MTPTPFLGLPFPAGADDVDVPADLERLATAVETRIGVAPFQSARPHGGSLGTPPNLTRSAANTSHVTAANEIVVRAPEAGASWWRMKLAAGDVNHPPAAAGKHRLDAVFAHAVSGTDEPGDTLAPIASRGAEVATSANLPEPTLPFDHFPIGYVYVDQTGIPAATAPDFIAHVPDWLGIKSAGAGGSWTQSYSPNVITNTPVLDAGRQGANFKANQVIPASTWPGLSALIQASGTVYAGSNFNLYESLSGTGEIEIGCLGGVMSVTGAIWLQVSCAAATTVRIFTRGSQVLWIHDFQVPGGSPSYLTVPIAGQVTQSAPIRPGISHSNASNPLTILSGGMFVQELVDQ